MSYLIVNIGGILLIVFIIWWFLLAKGKQIAGKGVIEVIVKDGIYNPATIKVKVNEEITLRFVRKDKSPCSAVVMFPQIDISQELAFEKSADIKITPTEIGEIEFTCQMNMYRGKLIIE